MTIRPLIIAALVIALAIALGIGAYYKPEDKGLGLTIYGRVSVSANTQATIDKAQLWSNGQHIHLEAGSSIELSDSTIHGVIYIDAPSEFAQPDLTCTPDMWGEVCRDKGD